MYKLCFSVKIATLLFFILAFTNCKSKKIALEKVNEEVLNKKKSFQNCDEVYLYFTNPDTSKYEIEYAFQDPLIEKCFLNFLKQGDPNLLLSFEKNFKIFISEWEMKQLSVLPLLSNLKGENGFKILMLFYEDIKYSSGSDFEYCSGDILQMHLINLILDGKRIIIDISNECINSNYSCKPVNVCIREKLKQKYAQGQLKFIE